MGENENAEPLDPALEEALIQMYGRVLEAQSRIVGLRSRRGLRLADAAASAGMTELEIARFEEGEEFGLTAIARHVHALGGHLEMRAVFPDETVVLIEPPDA
jgi:hypothetical protein